MAYQVLFQPSAARQLSKLPRDVRRRLVAKAESLADDPRPYGCERITGMEDTYRVRVGDYRIVYQVRDDRLLVLVIRVGDRKEVYRRL
ncbi:MAG: type II toxin-antitoxin system RelE/ParE family toxin [Phycisphaerae bacterium]